jgi:phospho-N-acetylmuramoyl-pentapeptide-transferase
MDFTVLWAVIIAFALTAFMGPFVIPYLRKLKVGQTVRDDGPESHLKKNGTPTMGGVMIIGGMLITSLLYVKKYPDVIPVLLMTVGFGLIGFIDDYIKVVLKRSMGLKAYQKLILQFIVTAVFAFYMINVAGVSLELVIPFTGGETYDISWLAIPLMFLATLGTVNGSNFTDGLDGLASSVTAVIAAFFGVIAYMEGQGVAVAAFALVGALLGFLLFNVHPASVFMGDTGSLALGGFVVAVAYMLKMPIFILIVAFIYFAEVLSVIIQVSYFKMTGGKRVFKMAPIHHHFELCGWSETRVVAVFTIITILLCIIGYMAY